MKKTRPTNKRRVNADCCALCRNCETRLSGYTPYGWACDFELIRMGTAAIKLWPISNAQTTVCDDFTPKPVEE